MSDRIFNRESFQQYLEEHKLMGARCQNCGTLYLPPRPLCPHCFCENLTWEALSGQGVLAGFTAIHIGPRSMIAAGYDRKNPYCSGIVKLEEGPSISAQILGLNTREPERNRIGSPLEVTYITREDGDAHQTVLAFELPGKESA
jgi:uncharacterized OB-fold protein